jgi:hypothetical protein
MQFKVTELNITTYLKEIRYEGVDWIHLAQINDRCITVAGSCKLGNEISGSIKSGEFLD